MTHVSRRNFLRLMGVGGTSLALAPSLSLAQSAGNANKNLVVVNLLGGADCNALYPYLSGPLATLFQGTLRPRLNIPANQVLQLSGQNGLPNEIGLHPAFQKFHSVARNNIKIVKNVGITSTDPGRSHDTCQNLMSVGTSTLQGATMVGWLARLMDLGGWNPMQFWALADTNSADTNASKNRPIKVYNLDGLSPGRLWWENEEEVGRSLQFERQLAALKTQTSALGSAYATEVNNMHSTVQLVQEQIIGQTVGNNQSGDYNTDSFLGGQLQGMARILKAKQAGSVPYAGKNMVLLAADHGYDSHSDQGLSSATNDGSLAQRVANLGDNLAVFYSDLAANNLLSDTVILIITEFGRTARENASGSNAGTDHGYGLHMLLAGGAVTEGAIGEDPAESYLKDEWFNAMYPTVDYRHVLSDIIEWMGMNPSAIFTDGYIRQSLKAIG